MRTPRPQPWWEARGNGRTVLLLHGLGASSHVWEPLIREAGDAPFRFVTVDLPCSGRSGAWAGPSPIDSAKQLLEWLPDSEFYVVGHSFGGVIGLELLAQAPNRIRGLIVLAAPALGIGHFGFAVRSPLAAWLARAASVPDPSVLAARAYLKFIWGDGSAPTPAMVQGYLAAMGAPGFLPKQVEALRALAQYRLPAERISRTPIPKWVLGGERDPLVPVARGRELARTIGATFSELKGAGHCLPEERPTEVWKTLSDVVKVVHPPSK